MKICPKAYRWNSIYEKLVKYSQKHTCTPSEPPVPLILAGWVFSSDDEKKSRWNNTVVWAEDNGCLEILDSIKDDDFYHI